MTAVNPVHPPVSNAREARPHEPSMEEILASIRRIIADDQSLPGRAASPDGPFGSRPTGEPDSARAEDTMPAPETTPAQAARPEPAAEPTALSPAVHLLRPTIEAPQAIADVEHDPVVHVEPQNAEHDEAMADSSFVAHGPIAAPQYASPEGPFIIGADFAEAEADLASVSPYQDAAPIETRPDFIARDAIDERMKESAPLIHDVPVASAATPVSRQAPEEAIDQSSALFSAATNDSVASAFHVLAASRLADNTEDLLALSRDMIRPLLKTWLDDNLPSMVERLVRAEIERVARGPR